MTKTNKIYLMIGFSIVSLWDLITTIYGTYTITRDNNTQNEFTIRDVIAYGFGIGLTIVLLRTMPIIKNPKEEFFTISAKIGWFLVVLYDLYTAFLGNFNLLLSTVNDTPKIIIAIGITLFTCYSPIYLSKLLFETEEE